MIPDLWPLFKNHSSAKAAWKDIQHKNKQAKQQYLLTAVKFATACTCLE